MAIRLFSKSKPAPEKKSAMIPTGFVGFTGPGRPVWSARNGRSLARIGYLKNPIAFRCIKMIAESVGAARFILQDSESRYNDHPIIDLLGRPNTNQSGGQFFEQLCLHLLLYGDAYAKLSWEEGEYPIALHILRSDRVSIVPGKDGWPEAYDYAVGKKQYRYKVDPDRIIIAHISSPHPHDDHYGLSPLHAAASAIDVHNAASQWSKALLDNAARPSGAIVYRGADGHGQMTQDQYTRLVEEIELNHQGARNAGRPMLLEGGLDWKQMGFSPSDMEFHRTKEAAAREIALALGVPPMLLGLPGDNTYSNYQEANRAFFRLSVFPLMNQIISVIGNAILPTRLKLRVDLDAIPALAAERESDWSRISAADFLSQSEKRQLLGFPAKAEE